MIAAMPAASPSTAVVPTSGVASVDGLDGGFAGVLTSELPVSLPGPGCLPHLSMVASNRAC